MAASCNFAALSDSSREHNNFFKKFSLIFNGIACREGGIFESLRCGGVKQRQKHLAGYLFVHVGFSGFKLVGKSMHKIKEKVFERQ